MIDKLQIVHVTIDGPWTNEKLFKPVHTTSFIIHLVLVLPFCILSSFWCFSLYLKRKESSEFSKSWEYGVFWILMREKLWGLAFYIPSLLWTRCCEGTLLLRNSWRLIPPYIQNIMPICQLKVTLLIDKSSIDDFYHWHPERKFNTTKRTSKVYE